MISAKIHLFIIIDITNLLNSIACKVLCYMIQLTTNDKTENIL